MTNYLGAIWRCRYFWMSLVKNDLRTRYRRSILGMGWSLLNPIAMTIILTVVFTKILGAADPNTYALWVLAGLAGWNYVRNVTLLGCLCLFQGESYIRQYPAPMPPMSLLATRDRVYASTAMCMPNRSNAVKMSSSWFRLSSRARTDNSCSTGF